jgi:DNA-binding transcriptional ArsR family regulator
MSSAAIFRALADPTRLAIFECVAVQELSVSELTERFEVSQPAISQHLSALRSSGLVAHRRDGKNIYYRADPKGMQPMIDWLNHYRAFWKSKLPKLESLLKELRDDK